MGMTSFKTLLTSTLFISIIFSSQAETLEGTAYKLLTGSQAYKADTYNFESTQADLKTASNLPDPELGGEYLATQESEDNKWSAELTWGLEWPGVYSARSKEAKAKISGAQLEMEVKRAEKLAEIKDLLIDYVQNACKMDLLQGLSSNNDSIYQLAENSVKGGELTRLDLHKIKLEYANIKANMAALNSERAEILGNLAAIYGQDCSEIVSQMDCVFPEIWIPSQEQLNGIGISAPGVKLANAQEEAAKGAHKVAKMESLPSISFGYKHALEEGMHFNGGTLGISIPMFSSRGKTNAAKAEIVAAQVNAQTAAMEAQAEADALVQQIALMKLQIDEIEPLIVNADYNATLLKAYRGGVLTVIDYLNDRNYFTNAEMELVTLKYNAAKAQARLQRFFAPTL